MTKSNEISNKVMIDPSLFIAKNNFDQTLKAITSSESEGLEFFISSSFEKLLRKYESYEGYKGFDYFIHKAQPVDYSKLKNRLDNLSERKKLKTYEVSKDKYFDKNFKNSMQKELGGEDYVKIADILLEEWVFLNSESWLVSRFKKQFENFLESGKAAFIRLSVKTARRTLSKSPDSALNRFDFLRTFAKWVAVSGSSVIPYYFPQTIFVPSLLYGIFTLIDP